MIATFTQQMQNATFAFALDGQTDLLSLNPLELTNFEMMGTIFGFAGLIITFVRARMKAKDQPPHEFTSREVLPNPEVLLGDQV